MTTLSTASLRKRFLAIIYDVLISLFLAFIVALVVQTSIVQFALLDLESVQISKTQSVSVIPLDHPVNSFLRSLWLIIPFLYFVYSWTKHGRTLGMKVWKIKAISGNQLPVSWLQSSIRFVSALLGLGYVWMLFDKEHLPLQDRLSKTRLIRVD